MDTIRIGGAFLVPSLNSPHKWHLFTGTGIEVEILEDFGEKGRIFSFSRSVDWELKRAVLTKLRQTDGYDSYKKEWEKISNHRSNLNRTQTPRGELLSKVLGDRKDNRDEQGKALEVA